MSSRFFVGSKDYCENSRQIDMMLEQFEKDRKEIISLLKNNPDKLIQKLWKYDSPICKDESCLFQMGKSLSLSIDEILERKNFSDSMTNFYICPQCKNMKRIMDFTSSKSTKAEEPFILECGERAGSSLYYEEKNISFLYMVKEKEPLSVKKAYAHPFISELAKCSAATCPVPTKASGMDLLRKYSNLEYLGSDAFTNNMLINWYLDDEMHSAKLPHIITSFISFICNDMGYNLHEYLDIGVISSFQNHPDFLATSGKPSPTAKGDDKSPISKDVAFSIIVQLFSCLSFLRQYDFSHGNISTNSIKFKKEAVSYIYDGVHVTSPVTLKLLDFSTSGCTVLNKLRLYSKSVVADEELKKKNYEPIIDTVISDFEDKKVTIYKLKNPCKCVKSTVLFMYMKHLGLPVYAASFDAYSAMIVLMAERSFYSAVVADNKLNNFWRHMWVKQEDFDIISDRLRELHEKPRNIEIKDIIQILSSLSLRCDMIDFGWKTIKSNLEL